MPAFIKFDGIDGEAHDRGYMKFDGIKKPGSSFEEITWTVYGGAGDMVKSVSRSHPQGVDGILVGLLKVPGYHITVGSNGIIAILIGLLLPAVKGVAANNSPELRTLSAALKPQGQIAFAMGDGSVRLTSRAQSQGAGSNWIDVLSRDWRVVSPRDPASGLPVGKR